MLLTIFQIDLIRDKIFLYLFIQNLITFELLSQLTYQIVKKYLQKTSKQYFGHEKYHPKMVYFYNELFHYNNKIWKNYIEVLILQ